MTVSGTEADVNTALNHLEWAGSQNYDGIADLQITTSDLGTADGGAPSGTAPLTTSRTFDMYWDF